MAERSGIATRHSVIPDYGASDTSGFAFFPRDWSLEPFPSTRDRLEIYEREASALAVTAARHALTEAGVRPEEVTHLVLTTCTGFFAPGPDQQVATALGLPADVKRTLIGFMGCYAGFNGMRAADDIVRAHPDAVVLQVAVELCTLHFQKDPSTETLVSNLLFADGAASAVFARSDRGHLRPRARLRATTSRLAPDTEDEMTWKIGDHGFVMRLSPEVPAHLRGAIAPFVDELASAAGLRRSELAQFAVHPGGRRVLEATFEALGVAPAALSASHEVLTRFGNMSSATIFFVLDRAMRAAPGAVAALGFGPGLTLEGAVFSP